MTAYWEKIKNKKTPFFVRRIGKCITFVVSCWMQVTLQDEFYFIKIKIINYLYFYYACTNWMYFASDRPCNRRFL